MVYYELKWNNNKENQTCTHCKIGEKQRQKEKKILKASREERYIIFKGIANVLLKRVEGEIIVRQCFEREVTRILQKKSRKHKLTKTVISGPGRNNKGCS